MAPVPRRIIGTLLTLVLTVAATATFMVWPKLPPCKIPPGRILGYDESQGLLVVSEDLSSKKKALWEVIESRQKGIEIDYWCLRTGQKKRTVVVQQKMRAANPQPKDQTPDFWTPTTDEFDTMDADKFVRGKVLRMDPPDEKQPSFILCLSADAKKIAVVNDRSISIYSIPDGSYIQRVSIQIDLHAAEDGLCCFSPDGRYLAVWSRDSKCMVLDLHRGAVLHELTTYELFNGALQFSPDGRHLLVSDRRPLVSKSSRDKIIDLKDGAEFPFPASDCLVCFLADGTLGAMDYSRKSNWVLRRFRIDRENIVEISSIDLDTDETFAGFNGDTLLTARRQEPWIKIPWPSWTHEGFRTTIDSWLGKDLFRLRVRNPITVSDLCQVQVEMDDLPSYCLFRLDEIGKELGVWIRMRSRDSFVSCSHSSRFFAYQKNDGILVWQYPPSRPVSCFLTTGTLALLSVFILWRTWRGKRGATPGATHAASG